MAVRCRPLSSGEVAGGKQRIVEMDTKAGQIIVRNPKSERLENVRLSIDLQSLKQLPWERSDGTILDELDSAEVADNAVKWIDTSCMVVDCLTKKMNPRAMIYLMSAGYLDLKASAWSTWEKMKKQKNSSAKKEAAREGVT